MSFNYWLSNRLGLSFRTSQVTSKTKARRVQRTFRPRLECLEERRVLSTLTVINTNDSGAGSLRQAILDANSNAGADVIDFSIGSGVQTIQVGSSTGTALPAITDSVTIDGTSQPGYSGTPLIELDGTSAGANATGLDIGAASCTVQGLDINRFSRFGINLATSFNVIQSNYLGTDVTGTVALGNDVGVLVSRGATANIIGGLTATPGTGAGNVISGNTTFGIHFDGSNGNLVEGNLVGTDATGLHALGNSSSAVSAGSDILVGGSNNTIGGTVAAAHNVVAGNGSGVTAIFLAGTGNLVQGNYVGVDITGNTGLSGGGGIVVEGSGNLIGGLTATPGTGPGNVISGASVTGEPGVTLIESANDQVEGNLIGLGADGTTPVGNFYGIELFLATNDTIGGSAPGAGNVVSASALFGIGDYGTGNTVAGNFVGTDITGNLARGNGTGIFDAASNETVTNNLIAGNTGTGLMLGDPGAVVQGNRIGTRRDGLAALPNLGEGIFVQSAGNTIGGINAAARNVISGNGEAGIEFYAAGAHDNVLEGNYIGVGSDGTTPVPNTAVPGGAFGYGVWSFGGAANNTIGDTAAGAGNVIAFNSAAGVAVTGASSTGNSIRGNSIYDNGGLGIDLGDNGVTLNNSAGHVGPNGYQNFPVVTSSALGGSVSQAIGHLDSTPNTTFTLDFYASTLPDPSGYGEGQTYLGSTTVTTNGSGHATFAVMLAAAPAGQQFLSATATDSGHNTSEFSGATTIAPPSSLSGLVFKDFNNDGQVDFDEQGISGVTITLTGTDDLGRQVGRSQTTDANGAYLFGNLLPGNYTLSETQPAGYGQGIDSVGTAGGSLAATDQFFVQLGQGLNGLNYNYGERPPAGSTVAAGQTATIGFWHNKNGQALILALNSGSTSTQLGNWLAATLPNIYGASAGSSNLAGKSNADVAARFLSDFQQQGMKLDAQVLATALAVYVTNATLDPSHVAAQYGFTVSGDGVGTATVNVGVDGTPFGVANNTALTVMDLLMATNKQSLNGLLYSGDKTLRSEANHLFDAVNKGGDIL